MKAIHRAMIVVFVMFLTAAPFILSSHGQVTRGRAVDQQRSSVLEQRDSKSADPSGIDNTREKTGTDKSIAPDDPAALIKALNEDAQQRGNACTLLFCQRCEDVGGTCIHTTHGCYCQ